PSSGVDLHHSFRPHFLHVLCGSVALVCGFSACGSSESPSPFVAPSDAGSDAVVEASAPPPVTPDDAGGGPQVTPGEWGGPCLDDGQCTDGIESTDDSCDLDQRRCH